MPAFTAAVAPLASTWPTEQPPRPFLARSLARLFRLWEWLQTSHCGQYSVERMLALDEYCRRTSLLRVAVVCLCTPLSAILTVVLTECVPLRPPSEGALRNFLFWIRHAAMVELILLGAMRQAKAWIPGAPLTRRRIIGLSLGCTAAATALDVAVAQLWVFPIPFLVVLGAPVLELIVALAVICVVGRDELSAVPDGAFHLRRYVNLFSAQTSLMLIYPAYHALFLAAPDIIQRLLLLLLPGVSLALKNLLVAYGSHLEDRLPEEIVFTVDVFDALFTTMCMRTASSFLMVVAMVLLHAAEMALSLHSMHARSRFVQPDGAQEQMREEPSPTPTSSVRQLVLGTLQLLQTPAQLDPLEATKIRLLSGVGHQLAVESTAILRSLASHATYHNDRVASKAASILQVKTRFASSTMSEAISSQAGLLRFRAPIEVVPPPDAKPHEAGKESKAVEKRDTSSGSPSQRKRSAQRRPTKPENQPSAEVRTIPEARERRVSSDKGNWHGVPDLVTTPALVDASFKLPAFVSAVVGETSVEARKRNACAVNQTLQLLFNNECLGLVAYIRCVVPVMYLVYMEVLQTLPNRVYYPATRTVADEQVLADRMLVIGVLAAFQFLAILTLHVVVAARFSISTLYQIAFVLETHASLVQPKLASWLIFSVGFPLEHYGRVCSRMSRIDACSGLMRKCCW
jgi:hypothetical protein